LKRLFGRDVDERSELDDESTSLSSLSDDDDLDWFRMKLRSFLYDCF